MRIFCRCSLVKTEPHGLDGLVTIRQDVLSSIRLSMCCRSISHDFSGCEPNMQVRTITQRSPNDDQGHGDSRRLQTDGLMSINIGFGVTLFSTADIFFFFLKF